MIVKKRSNGRNLVALGLLVLVLNVVIVTVAFAQKELSFYFNPPDGTSFVETLRYTKSVSSQGVLQPETQVIEQKARYMIRKTATGYSIVVTPILPILRVSEGVEGLIRSMFSAVVVTYDLNMEGKLVRVRGTEQLMDKLREIFPQEMVQIALSTLGQAAQDPAKLAAVGYENRGMLGMFAGRTLKLDHVYQGTGNVPLPFGGSTVGTMKIKISWPTPCSGRRCARVESMYESTDKAIGERMALMLRKMLIDVAKAIDPSFDVEKIPHFQVTEPRSTLDNKRLVDPTTGLIYSENETKTLQAFFAVETQDRSKLVIKEMSEYSYEYQ